MRAKVLRGFALLVVGLLVAAVAAAGASGGRTLATHDEPLRGQWHLDDGGTTGDEHGITPESSGHGLQTLVRFSGPPAAGRFGNAFPFGPSSSVYADNPLLEPTAVTVIAWVRADGSPGPYRYVIGKGGGNCGPAAYAMYTGGPGEGGLQFYVTHDGVAVHTPAVVASSVWNDEWHLAAGTFDGGTARFYVDGIEIGSGQAVAGPIQYGQVSSRLTIGSYAAAASCAVPTSFAGYIDEVRVYARALSATEIARLAAHIGLEPPVLVPDSDAPPSPPPPVPDFTLALDGGVTPGVPLVVPPGGEAALALRLRRNLSSLGRVRVSIEGLPPGVTASFVPQEMSGTDAGAIALTVRAAKDAAPRWYPLTIVATPIDPTAGTAPRPVTFELLVQGSLVVRVEGIEITQAVQTTDQPRARTYDGVGLVKHKKTVVRVFADLLGRPLGSRPPFGMALFAAGPRGPMPGSPLFPEWAPNASTLSLNDSGLNRGERYSATSAFTFVLPDAWTRGALKLEARALASSSSPAAAADTLLCVRRACGAIPSRTLIGIRFRDPPPAAALSVINQLVFRRASGSTQVRASFTQVRASPAHIFEKLLALSPVPFHFLDGEGRPADWPRFRAVRFASDTAIWEAADAYDGEIGRPGVATIGVYVLGDNPGVTIGHTAVVSGRTIDGGAMWRPVTSVAHEVFHRLGFAHASNSCGAGDGEAWPVADGRLDSVGIDTTPGSGGATAPYRIIADTDAAPAYDLMSYCGVASGDAVHWISARNWNRALGLAPPRPTIRPWSARDLVIRANVLGSRVSILSVGVAHGPPPSEPLPSPYTLVARDRAGRPLASVAVSQFAGTGAAGTPPVTVLEARVRSEDVAEVALTDEGGAVVASRVASVAPPVARILSPRAGDRVGGGATLAVRWRATDEDGDTLEVALELSTDGGRTFHMVWAGPSAGGRALLPVGLVDATDRALLRLRVSDGFNEAVTTSEPFIVVARGPIVEIIEPAPGQRSDAGGTVLLRGAALDDRGRQLTGLRLRWFAGRILLGSGRTASAALPAGTRRVRLEATDAHGRTGSAFVRVRVRPTTPFFVRLEAPPIPRSARAVVLVVSATQPATLAVGSRRYPVGREASRISIPIEARTGSVRLRLILTAGGLRSVSTVVVRRR